MYGKILDMLSARWLIHRGEVLSYLPVFISFLNGNKISMSDFSDDKDRSKPFAVSPDGIKKCSSVVPATDTWSIDDPSIPDNSVAIIPVYGVLVSWKTQEIANYVLAANQNPRISSILFVINSPGGMVFYTDIAAAIIKSSTIPTTGFVMNMAASAAMWLYSAMGERLVSSKLDSIGSIGVMTSFTDFNGFLKEKLGISVYELYASKSEKKNNKVRELLKGNAQPIIDELDFTNEIFHQVIRDNLGMSQDSEVFSGDIYNAERAIDLKLADRIVSFEDALQIAYSKGLKFRIKSLNNNF